MKLRAEISTWSEPYMKNGVYLTNDTGDLCYAFAKHGSTELIFSKNPIRIDLKHRKFLDLYRFDMEEDLGRKVIGSKGDVYYVKDGKCTCTGFKYRGECKHV